MIPKAARARLQNIKISKYLETRWLTEDVFGECGRKPWRGDTPHAREPLTMSNIQNYHDFWVPYKNCRGQIPCENYCAMEALLYGCMTWAPRRDHYRLLRRTHHRLLQRVIGYRRERGTYRQLSYAQALKKTGCQSVEATTRQRRLLFAGAMARQPAGRLPKPLMDGKLVGGEDSGKGRPEQNWIDCLKDEFQAFGATDGSTVDNRLTFGVDRAVWILAAKMDDGAPWHKGVLQGAEKFMISWLKEEAEASRRRATKRDSRDLEPPTHL